MKGRKIMKQNQPLVTHIYTADPSAHVFDGKIYDHYIEDLQELKKVVYHNFIYRDGDFNIKISDEFSEVIKDGFTGKSL